MKKFCVEEQTENIINWIKDWYKDKSGYAIVCISGGKDSTLLIEYFANRIKRPQTHFEIKAVHIQSDFAPDFGLICCMIIIQTALRC